MDVGKRIAELREKSGYSQNRLAEFAGVSQAHLRKVELGLADITIGHLELICDALGITLADFFHKDEQTDDLINVVSSLSYKQRKHLLDFLRSI